mmetsp:Transcript_12941/g.45491  ORF Transcript_12941/g.45491 Transcript_12941/m.45491 type:complete len:297 (-) Transcript_12941:141-1031(-)
MKKFLTLTCMLRWEMTDFVVQMNASLNPAVLQGNHLTQNRECFEIGQTQCPSSLPFGFPDHHQCLTLGKPDDSMGFIDWSKKRFTIVNSMENAITDHLKSNRASMPETRQSSCCYDMTAECILKMKEVDANLALERLVQEKLGIEMKQNARNRIMDLMKLLHVLEQHGIVRLIRSVDDEQSILGFSEMQVKDLNEFNQAIRNMVAYDENRCWLVNGRKDIKEPTGPVYELLRQIGVKPMKGTRGPRNGDPGKRDFMYSYRYIYDKDSMKKNCNRLRKGYIGRALGEDQDMAMQEDD